MEFPRKSDFQNLYFEKFWGTILECIREKSSYFWSVSFLLLGFVVFVVWAHLDTARNSDTQPGDTHSGGVSYPLKHLHLHITGIAEIWDDVPNNLNLSKLLKFNYSSKALNYSSRQNIITFSKCIGCGCGACCGCVACGCGAWSMNQAKILTKTKGLKSLMFIAWNFFKLSQILL